MIGENGNIPECGKVTQRSCLSNAFNFNWIDPGLLVPSGHCLYMLSIKEKMFENIAAAGNWESAIPM